MEYGLGSLKEFLEFVQDFKICYSEFLKELVTDLENQKRILHENKICHRDLKPADIIIRSGMKFVFSDYGLTGKFENMTQKLGICGTLEYLPPEIQKADSSGIKVCEMNPYENDDFALKKIIREAEEVIKQAKIEDKASIERKFIDFCIAKWYQSDKDGQQDKELKDIMNKSGVSF